MSVCVDDIYFAAVNGELEELKACLEAREVDLNAPIDCGVNNGVHTQVPLLFSILNSMRDKGFCYPALDLLVDYGADLDGKVTLSNDAYTYRLPLLAYVLKDWKNLELMEYFLKRGAFPNESQHEHYNNHRESYPLLYFAIVSWESTEAMALLLKYGADPDKSVITYRKDMAVNQWLPPLFYTLINQGSLEKTRLLFQYGANLDGEVETGSGWPHQFRFQDYVRRFYSRNLNMLLQAHSQGASRPLRSEAFTGQVHKNASQKPAAPKEAPPKGKKPAAPAATPVEILRSEAVKLICYDFENAQRYKRKSTSQKTQYADLSDRIFEGIHSLLTREKKKQKEAEKEALALLETRRSMVARLNTLAAKLQEPVNPWWQDSDTFPELQLPIPCLIWMPFNRMAERPEGMALAPMFTEETTLSGQQLLSFLAEAQTTPLLQGALHQDRQYRVAELCEWMILDHTHIYAEAVHTPEGTIQGELDRFRQQQDEKERFRNMVEGFSNTTDTERYYAGNMGTDSYLYHQERRQKQFDEYEKRLRTATRIRVANADTYTQWFLPLGIIALDPEGRIAALSLYSGTQLQESYQVDDLKVIASLQRQEKVLDPQKNRELVLDYLRFYPMPQLDPLSAPPAGMDKGTWTRMLYAANSQKDLEELKARIRDAYKEAARDKRATLTAGTTTM